MDKPKKLSKKERDYIQRIPPDGSHYSGFRITDLRGWLTTDYTEQSQRDMQAIGYRLARKAIKAQMAVMDRALIEWVDPVAEAAKSQPLIAIHDHAPPR